MCKNSILLISVQKKNTILLHVPEQFYFTPEGLKSSEISNRQKEFIFYEVPSSSVRSASG